MSQGSEKSPTSSTSERTPSPIRETHDDEDVDQLAPSSPVQPDSALHSTQSPVAPAGAAIQVPAGMQLPAGFPPMMMMAAPDPNDPNAPPHPMLIPGGYTPMFYPYPGVYPSKSKRRQVKNACTNCQKACKKCDDQRPCPRCVKYGVADDCTDSVRKERKKGIKRGSYKKKRALICLSQSFLLLRLTVSPLEHRRRRRRSTDASVCHAAWLSLVPRFRTNRQGRTISRVPIPVLYYPAARPSSPHWRKWRRLRKPEQYPSSSSYGSYSIPLPDVLRCWLSLYARVAHRPRSSCCRNGCYAATRWDGCRGTSTSKGEGSENGR